MNFNRRLPNPLILAATLAASPSAFADVTISKAFGDHMVLQQGSPIRVWGTGDPGESVSVSLGGKTAKTTTTKDGSWRVEIGRAHV